MSHVFNVPIKHLLVLVEKVREPADQLLQEKLIGVSSLCTWSSVSESLKVQLNATLVDQIHKHLSFLIIRRICRCEPRLSIRSLKTYCMIKSS